MVMLANDCEMVGVVFPIMWRTSEQGSEQQTVRPLLDVCGQMVRCLKIRQSAPFLLWDTVERQLANDRPNILCYLGNLVIAV